MKIYSMNMCVSSHNENKLILSRERVILWGLMEVELTRREGENDNRKPRVNRKKIA